jgi:hypothetical protein
VITGPGTISYQFTVPDITATYYFRDDTHPDANGQFIVGGEPE